MTKQGDGPRFCRKCGQEKSLEELCLAKGRKDGRKNLCKLCHNKKTASARKTPEGRKYYREYVQKRRYNISTAEIEQMIKVQEGLCAICKHPSKLFVDHNHDTGKVRQLLCIKCNSGLGMFGDSVLLMEAAIAYIKKHLNREE